MRFLKYNLSIFSSVLLLSCSYSFNQKENKTTETDTEHIDALLTDKIQIISPVKSEKSPTALYMDSLGFINIAELDSSISVNLMYTQADNFTGEILYADLTEAYLHSDAAYALMKAQKGLKVLHPSYSLLIYDAARPMSVQKKMWNAVKGTSKYKYVSNPNRGGGLHNYGLAVDISIQDSLGHPLPMGTEVDHMGIEAHITQEDELVHDDKISEEERENRLLLRKVMREAGFRALPSEWWHFNLCSRDEARRNYKLIP